MGVNTTIKAVRFDGNFYGFHYMMTVLGWAHTGYNIFGHGHYTMQYDDNEKAHLTDTTTGEITRFDYAGDWLVQEGDHCYRCGHRCLLDNFLTDEDMELNWYPRPEFDNDEEDLL